MPSTKLASRNARINSALDIKRRAKEAPQGPPQRCIVMGCNRLTQRAARTGLSETHCKAHVEFHRRHGSYWRKSYSAAEIAPYRRAARRWLRANREDGEVASAIARLDSLLADSGRPQSAFDLRGLSGKEKARIALARLREAGKGGRDLLEIALSIAATYKAIGPRGNPEFRQVQVAKLAHRLASGTVLRNHEGTPYRDIYTAAKPGMFTRYPRATGGYMRLLGEAILKRAGMASDPETINAVLALASQGEGKP